MSIQAPTLQDLISADFQEIQCIGSTAKGRRCQSGIVTKQSRQKTASQFACIATSGQTKSSIRAELKKIASMLLCGIQSHQFQSEIISHAWLSEAEENDGLRSLWSTWSMPAASALELSDENLAHAAEKSSRSTQTTQSQGTLETWIKLRAHLDAQEGTCMGYTKKGTSCRCVISAAFQGQAHSIIDRLQNENISREDEGRKMDELAPLLLCQRFHQVQAIDIVEKWMGDLRTNRNTITEIPSTSLAQASPSPSASDVSDVDASPYSEGWSNVGRSRISTPMTSPPTTRANSEDLISPLARYQKVADHSSRTPSSDAIHENLLGRVSRNITEDLRAASTFHLKEFVPFKENEKESSAERNLIKTIRNPLTPAEEAGHIYAFQRKGSPGHVKIGRSKNPPLSRMEAQSNKCGFRDRLEPLVDSNPRIIRNHKRAELLVHRVFWAERRRERVCNNGNGCNKTTLHNEWFEIDSDQAAVAIETVRLFMERDPYKKNKELRTPWVRHLENLKIVGKEDRLQAFQDWFEAGPKTHVKKEKRVPKPTSADDTDQMTTRSRSRAVALTIGPQTGEDAAADIPPTLTETTKQETKETRPKNGNVSLNISVRATEATEQETKDTSPRIGNMRPNIKAVLSLDDLVDTFTCVGRGQKKPTCGNRISAASRDTRQQLLQQLSVATSMSDNVRHLVQELALVVHCKASHQGQGASKASEWLRCLDEHVLREI